MLSEKIKLKEIERKAYLTYHKDGILDIHLGVIILLISINLIYDSASMIWMVALLPIFYRDAKRRYTFPRIGYVKFSESNGRAKKSRLTLFGLIFWVFLITLLVWLYTGRANFELINLLRPYSSWLFAILSLGIFSLFGHVTELRRLYIYGVGSFAIFAFGNFIPVEGGWLLVALAAVIMANGLIMLHRFTQSYPVEHGVADE
jgi:hypothetical protein